MRLLEKVRPCGDCMNPVGGKGATHTLIIPVLLATLNMK